MRFVVDADLPRAIVQVLHAHGHEAEDVRDIGLGSAPDVEIAEFIQLQQCGLLTGDFGFADIRKYPPQAYSGIVVVHLPYASNAESIVQLIEAFASQPDLVQRLPGRLAIVEPGRVRFRPP